MKAITYHQYGPPEVLQLEEVEKPVPTDQEILIKIKATAVNTADVRLRKADPFLARLVYGLFKPTKTNILGIVLAGEVEAVGKSVTRYKKGDQVFGLASFNMGTFAEYICLPQDAALAIKPANMTFEEAAVIPFGGHTALHYLKKAPIQPGQKVLIYGASGAVGTAAVQLARHFGAEVTGVCSTSNVDLVKSLGAHHVIDYTKTDLSKISEKYDVVFDTIGKVSVFDLTNLLHKKGALLLGSALVKQGLQALWVMMTSSIKIVTGTAQTSAEDMNFLKQLLESGELKPVIDKRFTFAQMVEAHRYVDTGRKRGNVAVTLD
ncbi:MAG: NAD(P)-dependent alcohol dehydrogenase [Saprospiraceae bacterium]|nr:NAD(P)-dependent alcohol dehydrogenase [Saprospiraceae bacterium]